MRLRDKAKQKVEKAAAAVTRRVFKIDQKESVKETSQRHSYMMSLDETKELILKMNPGGVVI